MFSKLWGYLAAIVAGALAIAGVFYSGKSSGKDEAELEARDAVDNAEQESANDVAEGNRRVDEINNDVDIDRDIN